MILKEKHISFFLERLAPEYWNNLSLLLSYCSLPTIGSPIKFKGPYGLMLIEYLKPDDMPEDIKNKYFKFIYKEELTEEIEKEKEIDRLYESNSSIFIVFDKDKNIIGSEMFVIGENGRKLPISYCYYNSNYSDKKEFFNIEREVGNRKCVEIYKLIRAFGIKKHLIPHIIKMLFKAVWAKSLQVKADYIYLTCAVTKGLDKLYNRRLAFDGPVIEVTYDGKTTNKALRKGCDFHEKKFAAISKDHFWLQTYFRTGLKKKSLSEKNIALILFKILFQLIKIPFLSFKQLLSYNKKGYGEYWGRAYNTLRLFIVSFFLSLFR